MSILIKNMEMPTYDGVFPCRLRVENGVAKLEIDYIITAFMDERKVYPLVPVPTPHGRLGDLDVLYSEMETYSDYYGAKEYHDDEMIHRDSILYAIEQAPTIIPAEGNNNDSF